MKKYAAGDVVQWKTYFDSKGAKIEVLRCIVGASGAHLGIQLPERRQVVFFANEVEPVTEEVVDGVSRTP